jgi:hypothetical protein
MARFHPVFPLLKSNFSRRRGRTWPILGCVLLLFLSLTFFAVRYLPSVGIDPVNVFRDRDFPSIFAPPIPRPPSHDHAGHVKHDELILKSKIDESRVKAKDDVVTKIVLPEANLTEAFRRMTIDELKQVKSTGVRREKVREVRIHLFNQLNQ